jgi:predicted transcriptional regulator
VAERITVTIPNELHQRLQAVKEKLNVSRLCQEAIERAITIEEIKMKEIPVKEKVIERLRLEKSQSDQEWEEIGFTDGVEDAEDLSYSDFKMLENNEISEETREWIQEKRLNTYDNPNTEVYIEGWIKGASRFWDEIKGEVESKQTLEDNTSYSDMKNILDTF